MGSLQVLNALKARPECTKNSKGLKYVEAQVNGKPTKALVDTGASHNFITKEEAIRLGLSWTEKAGWLKTVNANARRLEGAASNVELRLGTWQGRVNYSVAPMDDFKVVLGMDFLRQRESQQTTLRNATCQGAKRGEPTYVAVLKEDNSEGNFPKVPDIIQRVLEENKDVMPAELPSKIPPRRGV
ncbi:Unknown protein [Striga hermonthica]|uniref:Uncharacterized protein n=1 Tax=Striga hermonthica TaxID=68872 RepID=A0A9N7NCY4_STRHE|nr:Unknown protein [Striga hermonthica]